MHALTTTSKSRITSTVLADVALTVNRIDSDAMRAILCYNFSLPVAQYGQYDPVFNFPVLKCPKDDNAAFDTCGDHTAACYYCRGQRSATHTLIRSAVVRNTTLAGFQSTAEPCSFSILRPLFHYPDQLKSLFPKYNDGGLATLRRAVCESSIEEIKAASTAAEKKAIMLRITSGNHGNLPSCGVPDGVARRADVYSHPDDGKGKHFSGMLLGSMTLRRVL